MTVKPIVHEIRIQNQVIFLDPPIEYARATWIKQLHDWLGVHDDLVLNKSSANLLNRRYLSIETDPKFSIRDWFTDAGHASIRNNIYLPRMYLV
jgi:hypothetical protein